MKCRHCHIQLTLSLIDLGLAPASNAYLLNQKSITTEKHYPLRVMVCTECWLVQTEDYTRADDLFAADYAYFSSYSATWLAHAEEYIKNICQRFALSTNSYIVEIAANDGYLLQFAKIREIPCLGIEPTASTAKAARAKGIEIIEEFFSVKLAQNIVKRGKQADLIIANNVLAHVPDINDFVSGFNILLQPSGVATFEFPHLLRLISENQFDTVYHEHYSYLSLIAVTRIVKQNGLTIFDVEELPTHGGSLRVYAQHKDYGVHQISKNVAKLLAYEIEAGLNTRHFYTGFQSKADKIKNDFLSFLMKMKQESKTVIGYGAAAKGNTLLNYAGVRSDLLRCIIDRNPAKQGKYTPGSHIFITDENHLKQIKPDYVVIFPWNLKLEVMQQLEYIREWGGQFVTAIPELNIIP